MQCFQLVGAEARQRLQRKAQVGVNIEAAILILLIKAVVGLAKGVAIHQLTVYQKLPPSMVTVAAEQGVVEIKNC